MKIGWHFLFDLPDIRFISKKNNIKIQEEYLTSLAKLEYLSHDFGGDAEICLARI